MKTREPWTNYQGVYNSKKLKISHRQDKNVSSEWRLFSKTNFQTCRSTYNFLCYRIESRTSKNSDELRASIEKAYVVARVKKSII